MHDAIPAVLAVLAAASVVAAGGTPARAEVDAEVPAAVKVKGTIAPSGEDEAFTFRASEGTLLTVTVKADAKSGLDPSITLEAEGGGGPLALGAPHLVDSGPKVLLKAFPLPSTGRWTLRVSGEGSGGYALAIKTKPARTAGTEGDASPGGEEVFEFAAPAGSMLVVSAKASKGSAAVPRLTALTPEGGADTDLSAAGKLGPTSHVATLVAPGAGEDLTLYYTNAGEAAGGIAVSVRIKPPKVKPGRLDVRAATLGDAAGGGTFVARTVGADGGTVAAASGALLGASLEIPAGALDDDTVISLASAAAPPPPTGDDQAAGPAVDLQPSGLVFDTPALLTLPFDPALVPGNRSLDDIRVLVVEGDGQTFEVAPLSVDGEAGTLVLPVGGFSLCIPVIRSGVPRLGVAPGGDEFWHLTLEYGIEPDGSGNDSRARSMLLEFGEVSFYGDGTMQLSSEWRLTQYGNAPAAVGIDPGLQSFESTQEYAAAWSYGADGRTIVVQEGDGGATLAASRDGSVLVDVAEDDGETQVGTTLALRKHAGPVNLATFDGTWTLAGMEVVARASGSNAPASVDVMRLSGTAAFDGEGSVKFAGSQRRAKARSGDGVLQYEVETVNATATYAPREDGTLIVTMPEDDGEEGDVFRVFPGRNADVMFLVDDPPCGPCTFFMVLVRQGSGMNTSILAGEYRGSNLGIDLGAYAPGGGGAGPFPFAGDPHLSVLDFSLEFGGPGSGNLDGLQHTVGRDGASAGGVASSLDPFSVGVLAAVDSKGKLALSPADATKLVGAVSPDGMFGFFVADLAAGNAAFDLGFFVKSPPAPE